LPRIGSDLREFFPYPSVRIRETPALRAGACVNGSEPIVRTPVRTSGFVSLNRLTKRHIMKSGLQVRPWSARGPVHNESGGAKSFL
jgi:hypothetical protein